ncbi:MAG TPA: class I SAM-dependent methyltransferase [Acidimicrobiales bacterium]|nr:class I SAM-dependent methyltransferase [Acidimicrobiales bacterium]
MIFQHPLAYLLGLEGLALLRAWAGDHDEAFVRARLDEVRRLTSDPALAEHPGVVVQRGDVSTAYRQWAPFYDEPRNTLFDVDEPVVHRILASLLPTESQVALDAACGTGRYAAHLVAQGLAVIGVDGTPEMLAAARVRVPGADFRSGDLAALPVDDACVDLVVCGLALSHVPPSALGTVFAEMARVLRPGGHLVVSDTHAELVVRGSVVKALGPAGEPGLVATYRHSTGDHLRAALRAGLEVRGCEELSPPDRTGSAPPPPPPAPLESIGGWEDWPWSLLGVVPEAARSAWAGPSVIVWHFQRP